jgi:hypothetical protein
MKRNGKIAIVVWSIILLVIIFKIGGDKSNEGIATNPEPGSSPPVRDKLQPAVAPSFSPPENGLASNGDIEIPFLGRVPVKQAKQTVHYGSGRTEQEWLFSWSQDGAFVQADYHRAGFQTRVRNYSAEDVHESSGEKIQSIVKSTPKFEFERVIKLIDGYCEEHVVDKVRVRRVMMASPVYGEAGRPLYLVNIWSDEVYPAKTTSPFPNDYVRVVLDESGKELGGDNGE